MTHPHPTILPTPLRTNRSLAVTSTPFTVDRMPDPNTIAQLFGAACGAALASAGFTIHKKLKAETDRRKTQAMSRPLYENGQRETIIDMIRKMRGEIRTVDDRLAEFQRDTQDNDRERNREIRRICERLSILESGK
jgi:hypothetical protein